MVPSRGRWSGARRTDAGLSIVCRPFDRFGPGKKNPLDLDINEVVGEKET